MAQGRVDDQQTRGPVFSPQESNINDDVKNKTKAS